MGEGSGVFIFVFINLEKEEMRCSRNRKVFFVNSIKYYNKSC